MIEEKEIRGVLLTVASEIADALEGRRRLREQREDNETSNFGIETFNKIKNRNPASVSPIRAGEIVWKASVHIDDEDDGMCLDEFVVVNVISDGVALAARISRTGDEIDYIAFEEISAEAEGLGGHEDDYDPFFRTREEAISFAKDKEVSRHESLINIVKEITR